jgi:hypothetical protein
MKDVIHDFGKSRVRRLVDGSYVAEVNVGWIFKYWKGISKSTGYLWDRDSYNFCKVPTKEQALTLLATRGF